MTYKAISTSQLELIQANIEAAEALAASGDPNMKQLEGYHYYIALELSLKAIIAAHNEPLLDELDHFDKKIIYSHSIVDILGVAEKAAKGVMDDNPLITENLGFLMSGDGLRFSAVPITEEQSDILREAAKALVKKLENSYLKENADRFERKLKSDGEYASKIPVEFDIVGEKRIKKSAISGNPINSLNYLRTKMGINAYDILIKQSEQSNNRYLINLAMMHLGETLQKGLLAINMADREDYRAENPHDVMALLEDISATRPKMAKACEFISRNNLTLKYMNNFSDGSKTITPENVKAIEKLIRPFAEILFKDYEEAMKRRGEEIPKNLADLIKTNPIDDPEAVAKPETTVVKPETVANPDAFVKPQAVVMPKPIAKPKAVVNLQSIANPDTDVKHKIPLRRVVNEKTSYNTDPGIYTEPRANTVNTEQTKSTVIEGQTKSENAESDVKVFRPGGNRLKPRPIHELSLVDKNVVQIQVGDSTISSEITTDKPIFQVDLDIIKADIKAGNLLIQYAMAHNDLDMACLAAYQFTQAIEKSLTTILVNRIPDIYYARINNEYLYHGKHDIANLRNLTEKCRDDLKDVLAYIKANEEDLQENNNIRFLSSCVEIEDVLDIGKAAIEVVNVLEEESLEYGIDKETHQRMADRGWELKLETTFEIPEQVDRTGLSIAGNLISIQSYDILETSLITVDILSKECEKNQDQAMVNTLGFHTVELVSKALVAIVNADNPGIHISNPHDIKYLLNLAEKSRPDIKKMFPFIEKNENMLQYASQLRYAKTRISYDNVKALASEAIPFVNAILDDYDDKIAQLQADGLINSDEKYYYSTSTPEKPAETEPVKLSSEGDVTLPNGVKVRQRKRQTGPTGLGMTD